MLARFGLVALVVYLPLGQKLDHGRLELWVVTVASTLALGLFVLSLVLVARSPRRSETA